jgi:hypothetical protein
MWGDPSDERTGLLEATCHVGIGSVKLPLGFASTVILGFSLLEIYDQDIYSLLDVYVFWNGASFSTKEGSVFPHKLYVCYTVVSARVYPPCHGVQVVMDTVHPLSLHYTKWHLYKVCRGFRQSQWPRGLRHELSSLARTLGSWVRFPLKSWMSVLCAFILCLCCSVCR